MRTIHIHDINLVFNLPLIVQLWIYAAIIIVLLLVVILFTKNK
ncbi:hypothetical protein [Poriferisphaera sp. WC338]